LHTDGFKNRPNRSAGDNAGTLCRRFKQNPAGPESTNGFIGNRAFLQGDLYHILFGFFYTFANGLGDFPGFAETVSNRSLTVANDNNRAETKAATAFDHFRHPIDVDHFVN
jgi:hypothetical protein